MPTKIGKIGLVGRGMSNKAFKELFTSIIDVNDLNQMPTIEVHDGNSYLIGLSDNNGQSSICDSNMRLIRASTQKKVEKVKEITNSALINLWNEILEHQREPKEDPIISNFLALPVYDVGIMTVKEARDKVEEEMKRRSIKLDFSFLYKNYKLNIKKENSYV